MRHSVKWIKLLPSQCGWRCLMRRFSSPSSSELPFSENKWQTIHEGVWLARSSFAAFPVRSRGKFFTRKGQIFHPGSRVIFHSPCGWWCPPCVSNDDDNDGTVPLGWGTKRNEALQTDCGSFWEIVCSLVVGCSARSDGEQCTMETRMKDYWRFLEELNTSGRFQATEHSTIPY